MSKDKPDGGVYVWKDGRMLEGHGRQRQDHDAWEPEAFEKLFGRHDFGAGPQLPSV